MTDVEPESTPTEGVPDGPRRKSLRELQRDLTREHIVRAALTAFDRAGFAGTTMDGIADEAQVNRGTLYLHFSNKADILHAALAQVKGLRENYRAAADAATREDVTRVFERALAYWHGEAGGVWRHMRDAAAVDPAIRAWQLDYEERQRQVLQDVLTLHGVPADRAPTLSFLMMSMYAEVMYQMAVRPEVADLPGLVDALVDVYMAMLRT